MKPSNLPRKSTLSALKQVSRLTNTIIPIVGLICLVHVSLTRSNRRVGEHELAGFLQRNRGDGCGCRGGGTRTAALTDCASRSNCLFEPLMLYCLLRRTVMRSMLASFTAIFIFVIGAILDMPKQVQAQASTPSAG